MARYFVIDFKKYGGPEAHKNVLGHNLRHRHYKERQNIDTALSDKNVVLTGTNQTWQEYMDECNEKAKKSGGRKLRTGSADFFSIIVDCSVVEGWKEENYTQYLDEAEKWLRERFRGQKILASVIHLDEKKPHLHFTVSYFNEERGRWSQKWLAQEKKTDLNAILDDFERDIGAKYGLERGKSVKEKAEKEIVAAIQAGIKEPSPVERMTGKKPKPYLKIKNTKDFERLARKIAIAEKAIKEQPVHQFAYRLRDEKERIEKDLRRRERELEETYIKLDMTESRASKYAQELKRTKAELARTREELSKYEELVGRAGGIDEVEKLIERRKKELERTRSVSDINVSFDL